MSNDTVTETKPDITAVVDAYVASWNEPDAAKRSDLVQQAWAPEATYTDPLLAMSGHEELATLATVLQKHYPGHSIRRTGDVDHHHNLFRFGWAMADAEGRTVVSGIDVGIVADDGRISGLAGFFDT